MWGLDLGLVTLTFGRKRVNPERGEVGEFDLIKGSHRYLNPDDLVGRKGLDVYSTMCRDSQIKACLSIKKASVLARGWEVQPVKDDGDRGKTVADFCSWVLEEMKGSILTVLWNVSDALAKGYSVQNLCWAVAPIGSKYAGKWIISSIKSKDPSQWSFDVDEYANITALRHCLTDKVYSPDRFVIYTYNPEYSNPYGTSDLRACYKNWWSKDILTKFWNLYLEKYGSPTVKGAYRRGTPKAAQTDLLSVLSKIQQESAFIVPEDVKVDLLETIRQGDVGYRIAVEFHNKEISKSILNMTLITDDCSNGIGSFAMAKVHLDVLRMCLKGFKRDLEETVMKEQVLKPLVRYNFGSDVPVPDFSLGPMEDKELSTLSIGIKNLVDCGCLDPKDPFIREFLGLQGAGPAPDRPTDTPTVTRQHSGEVGNGNDGEVRVTT